MIAITNLRFWRRIANLINADCGDVLRRIGVIRASPLTTIDLKQPPTTARRDHGRHNAAPWPGTQGRQSNCVQRPAFCCATMQNNIGIESMVFTRE